LSSHAISAFDAAFSGRMSRSILILVWVNINFGGSIWLVPDRWHEFILGTLAYTLRRGAFSIVAIGWRTAFAVSIPSTIMWELPEMYSRRAAFSAVMESQPPSTPMCSLLMIARLGCIGTHAGNETAKQQHYCFHDNIPFLRFSSVVIPVPGVDFFSFSVVRAHLQTRS